MFGISIVTPLKETKFSCPGAMKCQYLIDQEVYIILTSSSILTFCQLQHIQGLSMLSQSLWVHINICSLPLEDAVSLKLSTHFGSYNLPTSSSKKIPEPREAGCVIDIPYRAEHFKVFYSLHVDQFWVSVLLYTT